MAAVFRRIHTPPTASEFTIHRLNRGRGSPDISSVIHALASAKKMQDPEKIERVLYALKAVTRNHPHIHTLADAAIKAMESRDMGLSQDIMSQITGMGPTGDVVAGVIEGTANSVGNLATDIGNAVDKGRLTTLQIDLNKDLVALAETKAEYLNMVRNKQKIIKQWEHDRYHDFDHFPIVQLRLPNFGFKNRQQTIGPWVGTPEYTMLQNADKAMDAYFKVHKDELKAAIKEYEESIAAAKKELKDMAGSGPHKTMHYKMGPSYMSIDRDVRMMYPNPDTFYNF